MQSDSSLAFIVVAKQQIEQLPHLSGHLRNRINFLIPFDQFLLLGQKCREAKLFMALYLFYKFISNQVEDI